MRIRSNGPAAVGVALPGAGGTAAPSGSVPSGARPNSVAGSTWVVGPRAVVKPSGSVTAARGGASGAATSARCLGRRASGAAFGPGLSRFGAGDFTSAPIPVRRRSQTTSITRQRDHAADVHQAASHFILTTNALSST